MLTRWSPFKTCVKYLECSFWNENEIIIWQSSIIFLIFSLVEWRMAPTESWTNNLYTISKSRYHRETFTLSVPKSCCSSLCPFHSSLFFALNLNCQNIHCKLPQISPGAYIFQRPLLWRLSLDGPLFGGAYIRREICVSESIGLAYSGKEIKLALRMKIFLKLSHASTLSL